MNILPTGKNRSTSTARREGMTLQAIERARGRVSEWKLKLFDFHC